jgi:hypothetical protein
VAASGRAPRRRGCGRLRPPPGGRPPPGWRAHSAGDIGGEGQRLFGAVHAHDARAQPRRAQRVGQHRVVVLFPHPALVGVVGAGDQRAQRVDRVDPGHFAQVGGGGVSTQGRSYSGASPDSALSGRSALVSLPCRTRKRSSAMVSPTTAKSRSHFSKIGAGLGLLFGTQHHEHALLGFREHHLIGGHAFLAAGHAVQVEPDAQIALVAHLDRRAGQPGRAHVLNRDHRARGHQLQAGLQQALFGERVAHLHGGALFLDRVVEFGRGHGRAADPSRPVLAPR